LSRRWMRDDRPGVSGAASPARARQPTDGDRRETAQMAHPAQMAQMALMALSGRSGRPTDGAFVGTDAAAGTAASVICRRRWCGGRQSGRSERWRAVRAAVRRFSDVGHSKTAVDGCAGLAYNACRRGRHFVAAQAYRCPEPRLGGPIDGQFLPF